jgi:NADPH-dependent 2,4-dienoyl-CoA reductase/sulfur reductase-like enzyme
VSSCSSSNGRLVILGGSDAGIAAALRARELAPAADVSVLLADDFPNFSICGLPYWLGGEVRDGVSWPTARSPISTPADFGFGWPRRPSRSTRSPSRSRYGDGASGAIAYDRLVVATAADPVVLALPGVDLPGVHLLHHMEQAFQLDRAVRDRQAESALIIGAG